MIVIIGGSGFVGSYLISELDGNSVVNIDKAKSVSFQDKTLIMDIRDPKTLKLPQNTKTVILLAAEHRDDVSPISLYYDTNVEGTKNVLNAMDEVGATNLIFTSSVAVYGLNKQNPDENFPVEPFNDYGKSKLEAEREIKRWYERNNRSKSVTIIRPTVIFGERNRGNVYNLLMQISSGKFFMIGNGLNKKSMAYVGNVVGFIMNRISNQTPGFEIFNYSDKPDFTMKELVLEVGRCIEKKIPLIKIPKFVGLFIGYIFDILSFITNKKFAISSIRVKKFCATTQFNALKAHEIYESKYSLKEGLHNTLNFEFSKNA